MLALYSVSTRRLSAFGCGVGAQPPDARERIFDPHPPNRNPFRRRRQPSRVIANELLAEMQPGRLLERDQRFDRRHRHGRLARFPAVAQFHDDRPIRRQVIGERFREPGEPVGKGFAAEIAVFLFATERERGRGEDEWTWPRQRRRRGRRGFWRRRRHRAGPPACDTSAAASRP